MYPRDGEPRTPLRDMLHMADDIGMNSDSKLTIAKWMLMNGSVSRDDHVDDYLVYLTMKLSGSEDYAV